MNYNQIRLGTFIILALGLLVTFYGVFMIIDSYQTPTDSSELTFLKPSKYFKDTFLQSMEHGLNPYLPAGDPEMIVEIIPQTSRFTVGEPMIMNIYVQDISLKDKIGIFLIPNNVYDEAELFEYVHDGNRLISHIENEKNKEIYVMLREVISKGEELHTSNLQRFSTEEGKDEKLTDMLYDKCSSNHADLGSNYPMCYLGSKSLTIGQSDSFYVMAVLYFENEDLGESVRVSITTAPSIRILEIELTLQLMTNEALLQDILSSEKSNKLVEGLTWIATGGIPLGFALVLIDRFIWSRKNE